MGKSKKRRSSPSRQRSTLAQHRQRGKTFTPPLQSFGAPLREIPWLRDVFPDMLWICATLENMGEARGISACKDVLDRLTPLIPASETDEERPAELLTGSLTSFELVPVNRRQEALDLLKDDGLYEDAFPCLLVRALGKYSDLPGGWLLDGRKDNVQIVPEKAPEQFLQQLAHATWGGQTRTATLCKAIWLRAYLYAGRIHIPADMTELVDLMSRYPAAVTEEERMKVEPSLRAMFGAVYGGLGQNAEFTAAGVRWAKSFWRQNWSLYACMPTEPAVPTSASEDGIPPWKAQQDAWAADLAGIEQRFVEAEGAADPDLYRPDRHEVLTGITYRHLRAVSAIARYPGFWTMEHGASTIRNLVEARIIQKWLISKADESYFSKFKDYGRGHLKLHLLHMREFRDSIEGDAPELDEEIAYMEALLNRDRFEEFQAISIEGNFAGTNLRQMADSTDLLTVYRLLHAPMSANVHGEWTALDRYALAPCLNPLHRDHRILNTNTTVLLGPRLVDTALGILGELVNEYVTSI